MRRLASLLVLLLPAALGAQGRIIPRPCVVPRPVPMPIDDRPAPIVPPRPCPGPSAVVRTRSDVRVELRDRVLRYEIEERFVNRGGAIGEADYLFPLPKGAAFQDLKLSIDGELVAGETLGADEARRVYEEIVRRQRDPALVEWMGQGLLRTRIFPFRPGEERRVVVRLQAVAEREGDALRVDWTGGTAEVDAGAGVPFRWGAPPTNQSTSSRDDVRDRSDARDIESTRASFSFTYDPREGLGAPYSPTHALRVREAGGRTVVEARGEGRGVTLLVPLRRGDGASVTMLTHAPGGEDAFSLVTLAPPPARAEPTPRDLTLVLDVSGSMSGRKLEQARAAGRQLLATLRERDRFRLVAFSTEIDAFDDDFRGATRANVRAAERWLDGLEASGSTNVAGALDEALRPAPVEGRLPLVLFVTDGAPTVGERDPEAIAAAVARRRGARRLFTFGVGADLNAALLERLAVEGRGAAHFVRPDESVERVVAVAAQRLVDPVVTDLRVRAEGDAIRLVQTMPQGAVDLFAGQDLVLLTRVRGSGRTRLVFEGMQHGRPVRWTHDVDVPARARGDAFVARLWATQRVGWLSAERRRGGETSEIDAEIRRLGERFGIPTELTSYFVREPGTVANAPQQLRDMSVGIRGRAAAQLEAVVVTGADAAAPPTAERRFEAAKTAASQRTVTSVATADSIGDAAGAANGVATRRLGSRTFTRSANGAWIDARPAGTLRVVRVRAYSKAWFALADALPELREAFALGERVRVVGRAVVVETGDAGTEEVSPSALRDILQGW